MIAVAVVAIVAPPLVGHAAVAATATAPTVAATGLTAVLGATGAAIVGGGLAAAAGSIISQGFGVATGIQDKFSWKAVGLAAVSGAVGGAAGKLLPNAIGGSKLVADVVRGVASSAATQGLAVATGLQDRFDWAGVAAAGVGAGIGGAINRTLAHNGIGAEARTPEAAKTNIGNAANQLVSGMAGAIANAAVRGIIQGGDFGDNIMAALPDVIGSTVGNAIAGGIISAGTKKAAYQGANGSTEATSESPDNAGSGQTSLAGGKLGRLPADPWGIDAALKDIEVKQFDLNAKATGLLIQAAGGDVLRARQMLKEAFAPTLTEASSTAAASGGAGNPLDGKNVRLRYSGNGPVSVGPGVLDSNTPYALSKDMSNIGRYEASSDLQSAPWAINRERTAAMNAAVASFDRQVGILVTAPAAIGGLLAGGAVAAPIALSAGQDFVYANALRISVAGQFGTDIIAGTQVSTYLPVSAGVATASLATAEGIVVERNLGSLTTGEALRIQSFADKYGTTVNVVGSRAKGTAGPLSDFDYILGDVGATSKLRGYARQQLPRGLSGGEIGPDGIGIGIDVFKAPLDRNLPYIPFDPKVPK